jgi:hypothetical protein
MGRTRAIRFVVNVTPVTGYQTPSEWQTKFAGRPSDANLAKWVALYHESLAPGGVNAHIGPSGRLVAATVIDQHTGDVRARWTL